MDTRVILTDMKETPLGSADLPLFLHELVSDLNVMLSDVQVVDPRRERLDR